MFTAGKVDETFVWESWLAEKMTRGRDETFVLVATLGFSSTNCHQLKLSSRGALSATTLLAASTPPSILEQTGAHSFEYLLQAREAAQLLFGSGKDHSHPSGELHQQSI